MKTQLSIMSLIALFLIGVTSVGSAETVTQGITGIVFLTGTDLDEQIEIFQEPNGELFLVVSDSQNPSARYHSFFNVSGLVMNTLEGHDTVTLRGEVVLDGSVLIDLHQGDDRFECRPGTDLIIARNFSLELGDGINEIQFSLSSSSLTIGGSFLIGAETGLNIVELSKCSVVGDVELFGGDGFNSLWSGRDFVTNGAIDGLSIGGDINLFMSEHSAPDAYTDIVDLRRCYCEGNLYISTGGFDDQIVVEDTEVVGDTLIEARDGRDVVILNNCIYRGAVDILTGKKLDEILIQSTSIYDIQIWMGAGRDVVTFSNSVISLPALIDGGSGSDTGNRVGTTFKRGVLKLRVENGNL